MAYDKDALPVDDFTGEGVVDVDKSAKIDTSRAADSALTPADRVKPQDIGTLSIEYRDGQPVIVASGGKAIPARLTVVDGAGNSVAAYTAGPPLASDARTSKHEIPAYLTQHGTGPWGDYLEQIDR
ncbi:hypothetical protein [Streptomyces sp. NPDC001903]|uniref:hypothetical protein n=1 Tax=Streptomyces sp. NPDC001903 TaxID=3364622 RepID=UPI003691D2D5